MLSSELFDLLVKPKAGHFLNRFVLAYLLWNFSIFSSSGQVGTINLMNAPQSPQAAALGKYAEVPVSLYTGQVNVSIPLYTLDLKGIQLPISLSYNATGLKVKEIPGQVGAGWSLNAGGVITRVVMGRPDDYEYFNGQPDYNDQYYSDTHVKVRTAATGDWENVFNLEDRYRAILNSPGVMTEPAQYADYDIYNQNIDTEVDFYYFNFMGYSGQFTFTNEGQPFLLSGTEGLKIEYINKRYKLTDPKGIEYYFGEIEKSLDQRIGAASGFGSMYANSWYLSQIYLPVHKQTVNLSYTRYGNGDLIASGKGDEYVRSLSSQTERIRYLHDIPVSYIQSQPLVPPCNVYDNISTGPSLFNYFYSDALFLNEISWDNEKISFTGGLNRTDMYRYKLDAMRVTSSGNLLREVIFSYNYFNSTAANVSDRKLKLTNVSINGQQYQLQYYESLYGKQVPGIGSSGQDFWGYYNGEDDETNVLPSFKKVDDLRLTDLAIDSYLGDQCSTPKNPAAKFSRLGSLSSIVYPTGGKTSFEYEGNDYSKASFLPGAGSIETDMYNQFQLQSSRIKQLEIHPIPANSAGYLIQNREFIVHQSQVASLEMTAGLLWFMHTDMTYTSYMDSVFANNASSSIKLQRYNEETNVFEDVRQISSLPAQLIGPVYSQEEFESKRGSGYTGTPAESLQLTEGRYRLIAEATGWYVGARMTVNVTFPYLKSAGIYNGAGIRIKKVSFFSNVNTAPELVKEYLYEANGESSGVLESPFGNVTTSVYMTSPHYYGGGSVSNEGYIQSACYFADFNRQPSVPLGNASGGIIGYSVVTEQLQDGSKTMYHFTNGLTNGGGYEDEFLVSMPPVNGILSIPSRFRIKYDNSWKRGLQWQKDYYNAAGALVKRETAEYSFIHNNTYKSAISMVLSDLRFRLGAGEAIIPYFSGYDVTPQFYFRYHRLALKTSETVTNYLGSGMLTDVTQYGYRANGLPHAFPVSITHFTSTGQNQTNIRYPLDYLVGTTPSISTAKSIKNLIDKNVVDQPIEVWVQKADRLGNNKKTISGKYYSFKEAVAVPDIIYNMEITSGLSSYQEVQINSSTVIKDDHYQPLLQFAKYDDWGNIIEQSNVGNVTESFIWGYNHRYPVAKIVGAAYDQVVAFINPLLVNDPPSEAQLLQELNKIRVGLTGSGALVSTYAHIALKGISVEIDPAGRKTSFIYDSEGRLSLIKDQNGNILKKFCYNYYGQPENCP